ncbi:MAG TPA: tyrosine--tRNA ligase [Candidatus Andersenbacteria bacterium]|nr:tyrosine--tRNA ligase [Candidatus Andersenbacteria bacterium]
MTEKEEIIKRLESNLAEIITPEEFRALIAKIESGEKVTHYIGFEISGYVHIGQGIMSALVIKDLKALGVHCTIWLADWHTSMNDKLDGTKETAARIGRGYFTEAMKACLLAVGADINAVEFRLATDWYSKNMMEYMGLTVRVMQKTTDSRIRRSIDIMGREMGDDVEMSSLMYPAMQVADVFYQDLNIVHAGTDQRKVYVIMRDVAKKLFPGKQKPTILLHALMPGLKSPDGKMSKSDPDSALFIHDSEEFIERKIRHAYCPEKEIEKNPILNWTKHLLFWNRSKPFQIKRNPEYGGDVIFENYEQLEEAFGRGDVHPSDLKNAVAEEFIALLSPVREHFAKPEIAAMKKELDDVIAKRG